jgi:hypothetical protein
MTQAHIQELTVVRNQVKCLPDRNESIDKCRFCVHSVSFIHDGVRIPSPARDFCGMNKKSRETAKKFDLSKVSVVFCDNSDSEGFRSIMNVIG